MRSRRSPGRDPGSADPVDRNAAIRSDPSSRVERFEAPPVDRNSRSAIRRTHARARLPGADSLVGLGEVDRSRARGAWLHADRSRSRRRRRKNSPHSREELSLPSTEREVAFRKGTRYVARLVPRAPKPLERRAPGYSNSGFVPPGYLASRKSREFDPARNLSSGAATRRSRNPRRSPRA